MEYASSVRGRLDAQEEGLMEQNSLIQTITSCVYRIVVVTNRAILGALG